MPTLKFVHLWLGFGLLIAVPTLVLAVLGLRSGSLEEAERLHQFEAQQGQTALLADTVLSGALTQIEDNLRRKFNLPADGPIVFQLDRNGDLVFWNDRLYVSEGGRTPTEARLELPLDLQIASEDALSAEAQGDLERASALYRQIAAHRELTSWAQ